MAAVQFKCPHCGLALYDAFVKDIVKSVLVSDDQDSFDAPVKELLYALLEDGGAKELAGILKTIIKDSEASPQVKLRAVEIVSSCMKHAEKLAPPPTKFDDMDRVGLENFIDTKLGLPADRAAPESTVPAWFTEIQDKKRLKKTSSSLTCDDTAALMGKRYNGKRWFIKAVSEVENKKECVICYVHAKYARDIPKELLGEKWGNYPVFVRKVENNARSNDGGV